MTAPLRLSFEVRCSAAHAFDVWTTRTSLRWPRSHTVSEAAGLEVVIEGRPGGRIFERPPGGGEHDWGEVTRWEPPRRPAEMKASRSAGSQRTTSDRNGRR